MSKKWELKLREARELKKRGSEILFERVALLVECFDDLAFRQWCDDQGTNASEYLDAEVADTATDFLTLLAVMKAFPEKQSWVKHSVRDMIAEAIEKSKPDASGDARVSWKARCAELEKECERLRAEIESLKKTLEFVVFAKDKVAS